MAITDFQFTDSVTMSIFAILVVFLILVLLQLIIYAFKFLPQDQQAAKQAEISPEPDNDDEERMVAMLTAAALAKEDYQGNVKIKSIKRIG